MSEAIAVRMYNVGFGDCFLLRFPAPDRPRTMLIDCGQHTSSEKPFSLDEVVKAVIDDVTDAGGPPRIDVVAVTHRHQDHVRGFEDGRWSDVEVGEVWLPWTEDPNDPDARSLLERQSGGALRLRELVAEKSEAFAVAMNSLTNEAAMSTLHAGFRGNPVRRFLPERPKDEDGATAPPAFPTLQTDLLPGVTFRVLGPSRDESVIRRLNPPELEHYVQQPGGDELMTLGDDLPFGRWRVDQRTYKEDPGHAHLRLSGLGTIVKAGREDPYLLAVALESTVNNTSLMLLIQMGRASLLFPGDSQWGTWDRVLQSPEGSQLLTSATFYKVGHHGSYNATPRTFVETLLKSANAMVSVAPTSIPSWKDIPKAELLTELVKQGRCTFLVNSHDPTSAPTVATVEGNGLVREIEVPV